MRKEESVSKQLSTLRKEGEGLMILYVLHSTALQHYCCTIVTHPQAHRGLLSNVEQEELNHSTKFYRIYCGVDNSVYLDTVLLFVVVEYF